MRILGFLIFYLVAQGQGIKFFDKYKKEDANSDSGKETAQQITSDAGAEKSKFESFKQYFHGKEDPKETSEQTVNSNTDEGTEKSKFESFKQYFHGKEESKETSEQTVNSGTDGGKEKSKFESFKQYFGAGEDDSASESYKGNVGTDVGSGKGKSKLESFKQYFGGSYENKYTKDATEFQDEYSYVSAQQPLCPLRVEASYEEEVVEHPIHSVLTFYEAYDETVWDTVTERVNLPVTVIQRTTVSVAADPVSITETRVVTTEQLVTKARVVSTGMLLTHTDVEVRTLTATNTVTRTEVEPDWKTLTLISTLYVTSTVPVMTTFVDWISQVEMVTQPVYVTTTIWVEAPQISVITSTEVHPHYMTTTEFISKVVYETVCEN